jgi:hypothetical protein
MIELPIASIIVTARSTSASFVANWPLANHKLSSSPTRTLPPAKTYDAHFGPLGEIWSY